MNLNRLLVLAAGVLSAIAHDMEDGSMTHNSEESMELPENTIHPITSASPMHMSNKPVPHVMKHNHGMPILQTDLLPEERLFWEKYNTTNSYINYPGGNKSSLMLYIICFGIAFVIINPLLMAIDSIDEKSLVFLIGMVINAGISVLGFFNYWIFMNSLPDLYPGHIFNKVNWIFFVLIIGQVIFAVIKVGYLRRQNYNRVDEYDDNLNSPSITLYDLSRNHTPELFDLNNQNPGFPRDGQSIDGRFAVEEELPIASDLTNHLRNLRPLKIYENSLVSNVVDKFGKSSVIIFQVLKWFNLVFFWVYFVIGVAVLGVFGQGNKVFNLLAHFIKGSIFFLYGIVTLARYCGAFKHQGWAWNYNYITTNSYQNWWLKIQPRGLITMEFIESLLTFIYGSLNVFLEHLANPNGKWAAKDLEHVSLDFFFIGSGAAGLLVEQYLNEWRFGYAKTLEDKTIIKCSPGYSPNPFPLLTIFWTGILMSQHEQASVMSTHVHGQWGNLFMYGTAFRFLTYLMFILLPKNHHFNLTQPFKPITEIFVAFCLIAGGLVFIESCDPIILALEYRGLNAMFTLNVVIGVSFLIMAWIMFVFQFKTWYKARYNKVQS